MPDNAPLETQLPEPPADAAHPIAAPLKPAPLMAAPDRQLTPAAQRALEEAALRRQALDEKAAALGAQEELRGRGGLDPVRYDDWDVKGIAVDF